MPKLKQSDPKFMRRALELAWSVKGATSPNPAVGAVVVCGGRVVGEGATQRAGCDHAEIVALKMAGNKARGADLYVTLEPCCHFGRTPPCTDAIIQASIRRVIYSISDPNPKVQGGGAKLLAKAGIEVEKGLLADDSALINEDFFKFILTGLPFVTLKIAQTWDGCIATHAGDSKWITSINSRTEVHRLRSHCDAVAVGIGTVLCDDPELTVRHMKARNPVRIILDSRNSLPGESRIARSGGNVRTVAACVHAPSHPLKNIEYWQLPRAKGGVSIPELLRRAGQEGIVSVLVEGGREVFTSFVRAGCVDKYLFFLGCKLLGGGTHSIDGLKIRKMADAISMERVGVDRIGDDVVLTGYSSRGGHTGKEG